MNLRYAVVASALLCLDGMALAVPNHLGVPSAYDNVGGGVSWGQTFVSEEPLILGARWYIDDPTRPENLTVNELVSPADLVLYDAADLSSPVELARTQVQGATGSLSGLSTLMFAAPVTASVGQRYYMAIEADDGFGIGLRSLSASTYDGGFEAFLDGGRIQNASAGRDTSFEVLSAADIIFSEDFESYAVPGNLKGQRGWNTNETFGIIPIRNGTYLPTKVIDGQGGGGNLNWLGHPLPALDPSMVTTLSFVGYAPTNVSPPVINNGIGLTNDVFGHANPLAYWQTDESVGGWSFDVRALTGVPSDVFGVADSYDRRVDLTVVIDGPSQEVYGIYRDANRVIETPRSAITPSDIASINGLKMFLQLGPGGRSGPEFDNIRAASASPEPALTVDNWNLTVSADAGNPSGVSSPVLVQDDTVSIPLNQVRTVTDSPSANETTYDISVGLNTALFQIDFDHVRGGIDNHGIGGEGDSNAVTAGNIEFTAADTVPYSMEGQYALFGSKLTGFRGRLFDVTTSEVLFENWQSSGHTANETFVLGETGGDLPFGPGHSAYTDILTGSQTGTLIAGHAYRFTYEAWIQTTVDSNFPSPNFAEASATGFVSLAIRGVFYIDAGPDDAAFVDGTRPGNGGIPAPPETITFLSLDLLDGSSFTLDPHETLVLTGGPLYIGPGAVFSGNGIIQGNVINAGLLRIPIVRIPTIAQTTGGHIQVELPEPTFGAIVIDISGGDGDFGVGGGTLLSFEFEGDVPAPIVIEGDPAPNEGTIRFDASLEITGTYEQRDTGALRLFIAGDDLPGENYSQLIVGEEVTLAGSIELVFDPTLFGVFGYTPTIGDTFDLIIADAGITIGETGIEMLNFVTEDGASLVNGVTLSPYSSGIAADPDRLLQISETLFRLDLVDDDTILRATLIKLIFVPEPEASVLLMFGVMIVFTGRVEFNRHGWRCV